MSRVFDFVQSTNYVFINKISGCLLYFFNVFISNVVVYF